MEHSDQADAASHLIEQAIGLLRTWADADPFEDDPSTVIDETSKVLSTSRSLVQKSRSTQVLIRRMLTRAMWNEWCVIQGERDIINEFEDDLD